MPIVGGQRDLRALAHGAATVEEPVERHEPRGHAQPLRRAAVDHRRPTIRGACIHTGRTLVG